jgi:hypothetical protein
MHHAHYVHLSFHLSSHRYVIYWVVTSESFSTVILSLDSKVETRSSGSSALGVMLVSRLPQKVRWRKERGAREGVVRESLDQLELVRDLAALGLDILLRLREVLGGRLGLESDLHEISTLSSSIALDIRCIE